MNVIDPKLSTPVPAFPATSQEFINLIAHYYRGEIARMAGWRDRIDRTTNWAITCVAAMLSIAWSGPGHHEILLFAMVIVLLLLVIESRRYRFFDVYRRRVRAIEHHYYAQVSGAEQVTSAKVTEAAVSRASIGALPGVAVIAGVSFLYILLVSLALARKRHTGELVRGQVHV